MNNSYNYHMLNMPLGATLHFLARAGGGGSDDSGGGELLIMVGYFPSYYFGKLVKKLLPRKLELIISASFASLFTILIFVFGILSGAIGLYISICIIVGIWAGWVSAFFGLWDRLKKQSGVAKGVIATAAQTDGIWNEQAMTEHATQTFMRFQQDWASFNSPNFVTYMTESLAIRNYILLRILHDLGRTNRLDNLQILEALIIDAQDNSDNSKDTFQIAIKAKATDQLIDNATGQALFADQAEFTEFWRFSRSGNSWLLHEIEQATANVNASVQSMQDFANKYSLYYSIDMGWLFLPTRGELFKKGRFGVSDINNHVAGIFDDLLVQLYTYQPRSDSKKVINYLVAQINVPKSYGGIIIQQDKSFFQRNFGGSVPNGYVKYEFEWPDFNKRYDVFATDADRLATFELLNPGFMAYLYDSDASVSIEVTDNVVYLYKNLEVVAENDYEKMMVILQKAHKELKR